MDSYRFLIHEYPTSKLRAGRHVEGWRSLQKDQLGDPRAASKTYDEFLKKYPRSPRRREAQEARAELALVLNARGADRGEERVQRSAQTAKTRTKTDEVGGIAREIPTDAVLAAARRPVGSVPRVRRISTSASAESTRVTIDLEDTVQYSSARIRNPDRIFFDIHAARLTPEVARAEYSRRRRSADRGARGAESCRDRARGAGCERREGLHRFAAGQSAGT